MKTIERTEVYQATPEEVFDCLDDLGVTGMHMTESSMPMMGGKMDLQFITKHKKGLNTKYKWTGKVLWWKLDFTLLVTEWVKGQKKTWETIGLARLIIYSWFRMHLKVSQVATGTAAQLSISYEKPSGLFNRLLYYMVGRWYCNWCLENMLRDTKAKITTAHKATLANAL
jgi:hypothetical protein